jgi:hypothetical protein
VWGSGNHVGYVNASNVTSGACPGRQWLVSDEPAKVLMCLEEEVIASGAPGNDEVSGIAPIAVQASIFITFETPHLLESHSDRHLAEGEIIRRCVTILLGVARAWSVPGTVLV